MISHMKGEEKPFGWVGDQLELLSSPTETINKKHRDNLFELLNLILKNEHCKYKSLEQARYEVNAV